MKFIISIVVVLFFLMGCAHNDYEGYESAIVVSSIEYDGKQISLGCKGDFKCDQETLECVYHFHKQAQNHIGQVKELLET